MRAAADRSRETGAPPRRSRRRRPRRATAPAAHELGVLFVHGIGDQERGATLLAGGDALHGWLQRWLEGLVGSWRAAGLHYEQWSQWYERMLSLWRRRGEHRRIQDRWEAMRALIGNMRSRAPSAELPPLETIDNPVAQEILVATAQFGDARLRSPGGEEPSHAPLDLLAIATDGGEHRSRWLLAESWWAQAFTEPGFRRLALWMIQVLPWTLGSHFGSRVQRGWRTMRARASGAGWRGRLGATLAGLGALLVDLVLLLLSIPLAVLAQTVLILVVLLALLPIARLRRALANLERALAASLGDSLVLLSSPLQRAAMVAQIRRDVAWLSARCTTVAVVAHSQGGALAHLALREGRPPNVKLLLTFGSGLRKLEELGQLSRSAEGLGGRAYLTAVSVALLGGSAVGALAGTGWQPWTTSLGLLLFGLMIASYLVRFSPIDISWYSARFLADRLEWVDYYSTADPVPNGALQDYEPGLQAPRSIRIVNERSFLGDHTAYWRNAEQFVGGLAWWLARLVDGPWRRIVEGQPAVWASAMVRRALRTKALAIARWVGIGSTLWMLVARRAEWRALLAWLTSSASGALDRLLPGLALPERPPRPDLSTLALTAGTLLGLIALARAARFAWDRWSAHELRAYFERRGATARTVAARAIDQTFNAMWFFYIFAAAQVALAAMITPGSALHFEAWSWAGGAASLAGFVAAAAHWWVARRAVARATADPPS